MEMYNLNIEEHTFSVMIQERQAVITWENKENRIFWVEVNPTDNYNHPELTGYEYVITYTTSNEWWDNYVEGLEELPTLEHFKNTIKDILSDQIKKSQS